MFVANITNGFRIIGIYPSNPQVIPKVAFAPSSVSRRVVNNQVASCSDAPSVSRHTAEDEFAWSSDDDISLAIIRTQQQIISSRKTPSPSVSQSKNVSEKQNSNLAKKSSETGTSKADEAVTFGSILKTFNLPAKKTNKAKKKALNYKA